MYRIPDAYAEIDPAKFSLDRAPIYAVNGQSMEHKYDEAFLEHPLFTQNQLGTSGHIVCALEKTGETEWFDAINLELVLQTLDKSHKEVLSANISPQSAAQPRFVQNVAAMLANYPKAAKRLKAELTEKGLGIADKDLYKFIDAVHRAGGKILLDDYPRGRWKNTNVVSPIVGLSDGLKFSGRDVGAALRTPEKPPLAMMKQISAVVRANGKDVVLEGIRSAGNIATLKAAGIKFNYAQIAPDNAARRQKKSAAGEKPEA
ncbi:MAG: EAL domain-containing protein [Bdellovibrionales bacterium]